MLHLLMAFSVSVVPMSSMHAMHSKHAEDHHAHHHHNHYGAGYNFSPFVFHYLPPP
jgi:hypothetical protein